VERLTSGSESHRRVELDQTSIKSFVCVIQPSTGSVTALTVAFFWLHVPLLVAIFMLIPQGPSSLLRLTRHLLLNRCYGSLRTLCYCVLARAYTNHARPKTLVQRLVCAIATDWLLLA
jgi:hypothetical protein